MNVNCAEASQARLKHQSYDCTKILPKAEAFVFPDKSLSKVKQDFPNKHIRRNPVLSSKSSPKIPLIFAFRHQYLLFHYQTANLVIIQSPW